MNYPQIKNIPIWPFCSEEDKKKDEFSNLPSPKIDKATGLSVDVTLYLIHAYAILSYYYTCM